MRKTLSIPLFLLLTAPAFSQTEINDGTHRNYVVTTTRNAEYPGGNQELYMKMYELTKYPAEAKEKHLEGDVMISFFVEADSSVKEVEILTNPGMGLGEEAVRIIKQIKFMPALQNGKPIRQNMMLSVPFRIYE
jgi:TonB family protein